MYILYISNDMLYISNKIYIYIYVYMYICIYTYEILRPLYSWSECIQAEIMSEREVPIGI